MSRWLRPLAWMLAGLGAGLLALPRPAAAQELKPSPQLASLTGPGSAPAAPWRFIGLPGTKKPATRFEVVTLDGQRVLRIDSERSCGNLVHLLPADEPAGRLLSWRWRVDQPPPQAWRSQRRDLHADFLALFGDEVKTVPPLLSISVGADADNTQDHGIAHLADLQLE